MFPTLYKVLVSFKVVRGCTFDFPQAYLAFRGTVEASWDCGGNVWRFSYSVGDGVVSDTSSREVPDRKRSLHDDVVSARVDTVKCF